MQVGVRDIEDLRGTHLARVDQDDLLADAIATVVQMGTASTSMLQRRLRVGYTRAGRLIDVMAARGLVSQSEGSKSREVLITREQYRELFGEDGEDDIDAE